MRARNTRPRRLRLTERRGDGRDSERARLRGRDTTARTRGCPPVLAPGLSPAARHRHTASAKVARHPTTAVVSCHDDRRGSAMSTTLCWVAHTATSVASVRSAGQSDRRVNDATSGGRSGGSERANPRAATRFEQLYLDTETKLFRYLARRVGETLAEDLTAEAFAIVWQRFADYDPSASLSRHGCSAS